MTHDPRLQVSIIGPSTRRQGLGPYFARFLNKHGAQVSSIVATSMDSAEEAREELSRRYALSVTPYDSAEAMFEHEKPDAVVIASPHGTHMPYLILALEHGAHVLCEKPIVWGVENPVPIVKKLRQRFGSRRKMLMVNCQWPRTLPTFFELYPGSKRDRAQRFSMLLSPRSKGEKQLPDCLPHLLSMLQALKPSGLVRGIGVEADGSRLELRFLYCSPGSMIAVEACFQHRAEQPRPAEYSIDGQRARRIVELPEYRQLFRGAGRTIPLPDPLELQVKAFIEGIASLREGVVPDAGPDPVHRTRLMREIDQTCREKGVFS